MSHMTRTDVWIYRDEISRLTGYSEDVVRKSEEAWGLVPHRRKPSRKCVRYIRTGALMALKAHHLIP